MERIPKWWAPCALLVLIVLLQAILFVVIVAIGWGLQPEGASEETPPVSLAGYSIIKNAVVFVALWAMFRFGRTGSCAMFRLKRISPSAVIASCLLILSLVSWDLHLTTHFGHQRGMVRMDLSVLNASIVMWSISLILLTPIAEELFFRGFALSVFGKNSTLVGVLGSSALCGLYHFNGSAASSIIPLPFALAAAYCVVMTGSVYPAMAAHGIWNLLAVVGDIGYVLPQPTRGVLMGSASVGALCMGLLFWMNRRRNFGAPSNSTSA